MTGVCETARDTLAHDLLRAGEPLRDLGVGLLKKEPSDNRLALIDRQPAQQRVKIYPGAGLDQPELHVVEGNWLHAEAHPALIHNPRAPRGVNQQVACDAEYPRDARPTRRVVLPAPLERPRKGLRRQIEDDIRTPHTAPKERHDRADMTLVEPTEILGVETRKQDSILGVCHVHILVYEQAPKL